MSDTRFIWHPDTRAFAAGNEAVPKTQKTAARIPAHPTEAAFIGIYNALGKTPFCVADVAEMDLATLDVLQFATLTGGTSGAPKIIARSQASWIASFRINAELFSYDANDSIAVLGGLAHSLALYGALEALHLGLDIHALSALGPHAQARQLNTHRCTILYATPTQLRLLPKESTLPHLRLILCGGGALDPATRAHIRALCPNAQLHVFYGAAETSFVTIGNADTPHGSVGQAYPQTQIEIRDTDADGIGEIWVRSPYLFEHYLQGDSPHTRRSGDWMTVGELGHLDAQGNLYIKGRAGRVITVADQTIYPETLEAQICALTGLPFCAVIARPDPVRGYHMIAVLPGPEDAKMRMTLTAACKSNGLHAPRKIVFLDPFPLLLSGKPDISRIGTVV